MPYKQYIERYLEMSEKERARLKEAKYINRFVQVHEIFEKCGFLEIDFEKKSIETLLFLIDTFKDVSSHEEFVKKLKTLDPELRSPEINFMKEKMGLLK